MSRRKLLLMLTPATVIAIEVLRQLGAEPPVPFLTIYSSIAVTAGLAGTVAGLFSASIASIFVIYGFFVSFGPPTLTGGPLEVVLGVIIAFIIGLAVGLQRDRSARLIAQLQASREGLSDHRTMLKAEVERQTRQLRRLSKKLLRIQEEERARLSRELHDSVAQSLTVVKLHLSAIKTDDPAERRKIKEAIEVVNSTMAEVRGLALGLRPAVLDQLGLAAAIRAYVRQQTELAELQVSIDIDEALPRQLPPTVSTLCFRFVQESVTNVIKHAEATRLNLTLVLDSGDLRLVIEDDGKGFDVSKNVQISEQGGLGISGMIERFDLANGHLQIESAPGSGTRLTAIVNAQAGEAANDALAAQA